jgi:hypothetical protein
MAFGRTLAIDKQSLVSLHKKMSFAWLLFPFWDLYIIFLFSSNAHLSRAFTLICPGFGVMVSVCSGRRSMTVYNALVSLVFLLSYWRKPVRRPVGNPVLK